MEDTKVQTKADKILILKSLKQKLYVTLKFRGGRK
jgi:hypothetical protein